MIHISNLALLETIDALYIDFTPEGELREILDDCQAKQPEDRPSSLDVLERIYPHRQKIQPPFQSFETALRHTLNNGNYIYETFRQVADALDTPQAFEPFGSHTQQKRDEILGRLRVLLND